MKRLEMRAGEFFIAPSAIIKLKKLSAHAKLTYYVLVSHMDNETKECYPSLERLQQETSLSRHTVLKAINELEQAKLIHVKRSDRRKINNIYTMLAIPDISSAAGALPVNSEVQQAHIVVQKVHVSSANGASRSANGADFEVQQAHPNYTHGNYTHENYTQKLDSEELYSKPQVTGFRDGRGNSAPDNGDEKLPPPKFVPPSKLVPRFVPPKDKKQA